MRLTILQESRRNNPEWNPTFLKRYPALDKFSNLSFLNMRATGCYLNLKTSRLQNKIPYRWHRKSSGAGSCSYKEHMSWNDSVTRLRAEYCIKILFINMTAIRVWLKLARKNTHKCLNDFISWNEGTFRILKLFQWLQLNLTRDSLNHSHDSIFYFRKHTPKGSR